VAIASVSVPRWASNLVADVCSRYHIAKPTLRFRPALDYPDATWATIGDYNANTLTLTVYVDPDPQVDRLTLIHELAHHVHFSRTGQDDHSELFWRYCWTLYLLYRVPLHAAILSEFSYMARAERVLRSMQIRLSPRATLAAAYGRALRLDATLEDRARRLHNRLSRVRSGRVHAQVRSEIRHVTASHREVLSLRTSTARAYKRAVRRPQMQ
jgi:hypothetical protein